MNKTSVFFLCFLVGLCVAFRQEIILYSEHDQQGDSITLRSKQPDLTKILEILGGSWKSVCFKGVHYGFTAIDYGGTEEHESINWSNTSKCSNEVQSNVLSLRHLGPDESTVPSISLYENVGYGGEEKTLEGNVLATIAFTPLALFTTGRSNWTLYSLPGLAGNASCYTSTAEYHGIATLDPLFIIGSVLRGCVTNRRIDNSSLLLI